MSDRRLDEEIDIMNFEAGWQRFFPVTGSPYHIMADFGIICAGMSSHRPTLDICRPNFNQHSAYFGISGECRYLTPAGEGTIRPGEIWLVPAMYPHRYWVEDVWTYVWVHFHDRGYWRTFTEHGERKIVSHRINQIEHVARAMLEYAECWNDQDIMEGWVKMLVMLLRLEIMEPNEKLNRLKTILSKAWREVYMNPQKQWRTEELAEMAHMSLTHFNRNMNKVYNTSARGMLTQIRLERAINLMRKTGYTLDRIAEMTGYSSGFALSKAFQRIYSESPRRLAEK